MKKLAIGLCAFVALSAFTLSSTLWKSDKAHSQLMFTITHLGIADVSGHFTDFEATINTASANNFKDAVIELKAKTSSINTRVEARDNHLRSADFFDAANHPEIIFKSTSVTENGKNKYKLTGNLTMHGITKEVVLDLENRGTIDDKNSGKQKTGFRATGTVKRSDFKIGEKFPEAALSDVVQIKADGEFVN